MILEYMPDDRQAPFWERQAFFLDGQASILGSLGKKNSWISRFIYLSLNPLYIKQ